MKRVKQLSVLFLATLFMIACGDRPMSFDKDKWVASYGEFYVEGSNRYGMMLWLEKNYEFCGKSLDEILDKFFKPDYLGRYDFFPQERIIENKKLELITKQYNPNFIIGIDPWKTTDWIELFFDDNLYVSKAIIKHYNPDTKEQTERIISQIEVKM